MEAMEAHPGSAVVLEREAPIGTTAVTTDSESAVTAAEITALSLDSELEPLPTRLSRRNNRPGRSMRKMHR
ncbi:hypothetical protein F518_18328 [Serratia marcescens VGH107]|nr:hypothetical protein F518_18328 [Serratia marcescens VGH107]